MELSFKVNATITHKLYSKAKRGTDIKSAKKKQDNIYNAFSFLFYVYLRMGGPRGGCEGVQKEQVLK